ncbi:NAD(P)-binding protein [Dendrothele bispora CBS 962.96]|uniref:NAD(P)-binding protein n=1 Tax=Dendrothele bispora (strain CBS 962.96) TaxID=1314807 RepID=A0A4S8LYR7_DENBC|nr:NAD(P)-binding protein [Dendrothele bispora CBS 962.96]
MSEHQTSNTKLPVIEGDVAFVTGAAAGFGLALSKELVSRGASVIMLDINEEVCKKVASELNEKAGKTVAIAVKADTTRFEDQLAAYELGKETFGRVDYFFANAGIAEYPWLPPFDPSTSSSRPIAPPTLKTLEINLIGQLNTSSLAFQVFERQPPNARTGFRGKLVMTASVYGYWPCKSMPMYTASKAGMVNFMRSAAGYYGEKGVTINLIAPNMSATSIVPPDFVALFGDDMLCPVELIVEQMISVLGSSKDNGRAISIMGKEVWDHPLDMFMFEKNKPGMDMIEAEVGKRIGLWA